MTSDLAEFLLARIADEEARVDTIPDWYCTDSARGEGWGTRGNCVRCDKYMFDGEESATKEAHWDHMEDVHRRTFVLAECDAKRRIIALHAAATHPSGHKSCACCGDDSCVDWPCETLRLLALPYATHPDYLDDWRP